MFIGNDGTNDVWQSNNPEKPMTDILDLAEKLTEDLPHGQRLGCTGLAAAWCPIHGDCICDRGDHLEQDDDCPLHGGANDPFTVLQVGLITAPQECEYPGCEGRGSASYSVEAGSAVVRVCAFHKNMLNYKGLESKGLPC